MAAKDEAPILLIGAGRMGGALLKGWIARGIGPVEIVDPKPSEALQARCKEMGITLHADIEAAPASARACVIAIKPQVLRGEAVRLKAIAQGGALMLSIAAGTSIVALRTAFGGDARILRAMPNTPGAIGHGISALYAPENIGPEQRRLAEELLAALGETVWVAEERQIDATTALSGSGPAYVFYLVEAMAEAGRSIGLPEEVSIRLARATISGAGALLDADARPASALRQEVTSPGGTTEAALAVLMADEGLAKLMQRAIAAAFNRAQELSL